MQLRYIGLVCLIMICGAATLFVRPVYACSPIPTVEGEPSPTAETLESRVQNIPVIFEGTVTAISEDRALTTVQVRRYFKGDGPGTVTVLGFGWGSDCLPVTSVGQHSIFYTTGSPEEQVSIHSWSSVEVVDDARVNAIIKAVGHEPVLAPNGMLQGLALAALIAMGILILVIIAGIVWLKRKRKET